ncbi:MAG TPA: CocE/NonD family hydrolase [Gaiella sp.]|uniref:alpha/beta hydrolase n=1 Tax=Gaiella sp. TaxID=2663207 RepID=UPI002D7F2FD0|nr:CocE/NonD family hydrolase [Gaiella sp.]HET9287601.1 CocE/NonD family hydrolase [Gaiella sp.]
MSMSAAQTPPARLATVASHALSVLRDETKLVRLAIGLAAIPILDDNFLHPAPGTGAGDHLLSGLVPLAVLAAVAVVYPRLRAGLRAATAMTLGAIVVVIGAPGVYYLRDGSAAFDHYTALLGFPAGLILLASGPMTLWKARRRGGSRRRRYALRASSVAIAAVSAPLLFALVVFPIAFPYGYSHIGKTTPIPALGLGEERVTVTTSDSLELEAVYVPSRNGAAMVVYPGAGRTDVGRMLARHGYGVLLLEPRGQGGSEGDVVRWAGDTDIIAGAEYLRSRHDVQDDRVGAIGFSIGGEQLLEAAARSTAIKAVVSEGAGGRVGETRSSGILEPLVDTSMLVMTTAASVFQNHGPHPRIEERIGLIAPRPVFLIYAVPGMGEEDIRQPAFYAAAGEPKAMWRVPGSSHTGGIEARPAEYERRVVAFLDRSLLAEGAHRSG